MFRWYYNLENNQAAIGGWVERAGLKDLRLTFHSWVWMSLNPADTDCLVVWGPRDPYIVCVKSLQTFKNISDAIAFINQVLNLGSQ